MKFAEEPKYELYKQLFERMSLNKISKSLITDSFVEYFKKIGVEKEDDSDNTNSFSLSDCSIGNIRPEDLLFLEGKEVVEEEKLDEEQKENRVKPPGKQPTTENIPLTELLVSPLIHGIHVFNKIKFLDPNLGKDGSLELFSFGRK